MRRREFLNVLGGVAVAWPFAAHGQQGQRRRFRVGWLVFGGATLDVIDRTLRDALSERGLIDGHKIEVIFRYANGVQTRLGELAGEIIAERPNILIGIGGDVVRALLSASKD
jgi:putative ABC transport system substrate-binding protein